MSTEKCFNKEIQMYSKLMARYYDILYQDKNYIGEINYILAVYNKYTDRELRTVLDFGCGTGNHSLLLAQRGYQVHGVDISSEMIKVANRKVPDNLKSNVQFTCDDIEALSISKYDLVISMFGVVNHIDSIKRLIDIFSRLSDNLSSGGIFIFDCWNGVAAIVDPPRDKRKEVSWGSDARIIMESKASTDVFHQETTMNNTINVVENNLPTKFMFQLSHVLWTPRTFIDILELCGLELMIINKAFELVAPAREDWRLSFVCRKS